MKTLISIETLKADLECAWEGSEIIDQICSDGDWYFCIDPESMDCLKDLLSKSHKSYTLSSLAYAVLNNKTVLPAFIPDKVVKLSDALKRANIEALKFSNIDDGGSCNFDSPVIKLLRWKDSEIKHASLLASVDVGHQLSGWWKGYRFVSSVMYGQGYRRTRMAEAAKKSLEADGYDVSMYYQMD